jgi:hypothetical protein
MLSVPSVTMKSGSRRRAIMTPFRKPQKTPTARPANMLPAVPYPALPAATMLERPAIDPTERSIPFVMITKVMPTAMTALIDD